VRRCRVLRMTRSVLEVTLQFQCVTARSLSGEPRKQKFVRRCATVATRQIATFTRVEVDPESCRTFRRRSDFRRPSRMARSGGERSGCFSSQQRTGGLGAIRRDNAVAMPWPGG
jgi:hypothetical protein